VGYWHDDISLELEARVEEILTCAPVGVSLAFCPTGEGNKVDNSCSPANKGKGKYRPKGTSLDRVEEWVDAMSETIGYNHDKVSYGGNRPLNTWIHDGKYSTTWEYDFETASGRRFTVTAQPFQYARDVSGLAVFFNDDEKKYV
jgi:hypothetical protein